VFLSLGALAVIVLVAFMLGMLVAFVLVINAIIRLKS
jgi:hypothetical protein